MRTRTRLHIDPVVAATLERALTDGGRRVVLPWWMAAVIYFAMAHYAMAHSVGWVRYPAAVTWLLLLAGVLWRRFRR